MCGFDTFWVAGVVSLLISVDTLSDIALLEQREIKLDRKLWTAISGYISSCQTRRWLICPFPVAKRRSLELPFASTDSLYYRYKFFICCGMKVETRDKEEEGALKL
jgi:hypothetical protein